jgi:hypothetical protein
MAPCGSLKAALTTKRPYVKIASGIVKDDGTTINKSTSTNPIFIFGDVGAILSIVSHGPVLTIQDSIDVEIHDLEFKGATGSTSGDGDGIRLRENSSGGPSEVPSLKLVHVTIDNNDEHGINSNIGTLSIEQSSISRNGTGGIFAHDSTRMISITNSFIYDNGKNIDNRMSIGGLMLQPMIGGQLQFDTIIDNNASSGQIASGLNCNKSVLINHSIIVNNTINNNKNSQTNGTLLGDSVIIDDMDNTSVAMQFRAPPTDYHLVKNSMFIDKVTDPAACTDLDFDDDMRPQDGACDLGADEWVPGQSK